jgi:hypothetical protein
MQTIAQIWAWVIRVFFPNCTLSRMEGVSRTVATFRSNLILLPITPLRLNNASHKAYKSIKIDFNKSLVPHLLNRPPLSPILSPSLSECTQRYFSNQRKLCYCKTSWAKILVRYRQKRAKAPRKAIQFPQGETYLLTRVQWVSKIGAEFLVAT